MWGSYPSTSQNAIQKTILLIAALCIPIMLFLPVFYHYFQQKRLKRS